MYSDIMKSKLGLVTIVGTLVGINAMKVNQDILKDISTLRF